MAFWGTIFIKAGNGELRGDSQLALTQVSSFFKSKTKGLSTSVFFSTSPCQLVYWWEFRNGLVGKEGAASVSINTLSCEIGI